VTRELAPTQMEWKFLKRLNGGGPGGLQKDHHYFLLECQLAFFFFFNDCIAFL
jgi:hypothetical protein